MTAHTAVRTLIVEDDPTTQKGLKRFVERLGQEATVVGSVREAIEEITCCHHVLLDMNLPDGTGVDVLRFIRARKLPVSVAILSGTFDGHLLDEANDLEPDAIFPKPTNLSKLESWLLSLP